MSAYAMPGLFPPLETPFHCQFGLQSTCVLNTQASQADLARIRNQQPDEVTVTIRDAKIDTATLIHALLLTTNTKQQKSKSRRSRLPSKGRYEVHPEEEAIQYELVITGLRRKADDGQSVTCKRSFSQIMQLYRDLLDEELDSCFEKDGDESRNPSSRTMSSSSARSIPLLPRLQDEEAVLFSTGKNGKPMMAASPGRGFVLMQELLRSHVPVLQDWFECVVKSVDPCHSLAWDQFLREGTESNCRAELIPAVFTCHPSRPSCEKLGSIEESDSEYDCEDEI